MEMLALCFNQDKVNLDVKDNKKETPLFSALEASREDLALMLIQTGCSVTLLGSNGLSPLMICCERNLVNAAKVLVDINPEAVYQNNPLGENSIQIAEKNNNEELAFFLLERFGSNKRPNSNIKTMKKGQLQGALTLSQKKK